MASEIELVAKQKVFISEIPDYFSASENQCTVYARFSVIVGHPTLLH